MFNSSSRLGCGACLFVFALQRFVVSLSGRLTITRSQFITNELPNFELALWSIIPNSPLGSQCGMAECLGRELEKSEPDVSSAILHSGHEVRIGIRGLNNLWASARLRSPLFKVLL